MGISLRTVSDIYTLRISLLPAVLLMRNKFTAAGEARMPTVLCRSFRNFIVESIVLSMTTLNALSDKLGNLFNTDFHVNFPSVHVLLLPLDFA